MINRLLLVVAAFFVTFGGMVAQPHMNIGAKKFFSQFEDIKRSGDALTPEFKLEFDLVAKGNDHYVGVLALVDVENIDRTALNRLGIKNDTRINDLWTFRVPVSVLDNFLELEGLKYIEIAEPVDPNLRLSTIDSRTDSVNRGLGLSQAYRGKGVIIAIIDWGFDYTHPNFYDTTLTDLRISRAWDQNKLSGPAPDGFSFGTEYVGQEALLEAQQDTLYVFGPGSHGTHVGGIAGGSGGGTPHIGAAPESELIFISLRRDGPSLVDAFNYVASYAESVNKPFVVNMSFGSHLGPHDGSSLKNYGIDMLHGPGRIFVGSAGNNGTGAFHLDVDFNEQPGDTIYTVVGFGNVADQFGQTVSMWGSEFSSFGAGLMLVDDSNEPLLEIPFYYSDDDHSIDELHEVQGGEVHLIAENIYGHFLNDKPSIRFEIRNTSPFRVVLMVSSEDSHVHMWNCVRLYPRYTNWGQPFLDNYPGALAGDNLYAVGEPGGVGKNVITVGSYLRTTTNVFGQESGGTLSSFSSSGPTVDGRLKPDITSTGHSVVSSVNYFDPTQSGFLASVDHEGRTYGFRAFSGTSMSGPMVAGIVALMLEVHPELSAVEAREILIQTARLDQHTGEIGPDGDLRWGHGKANALAAVIAAKTLSSSPELEWTDSDITVYPNPAYDQLNIQTEIPMEQIRSIKLIDMEGRLLREYTAPQSNSIDLNDVPSGLYLLQIVSDQGMAVRKVNVVK